MDFSSGEWFAGFLIVGLFLVVIRYRQEMKRSRALRGVALQLGLSFERVYYKQGVDSDPCIRRFAHFQLFANSDGTTIENRMYGMINGIDLMVFDYHHTSSGGGSGSNTTIISQTVAAVRSSKMRLPGFDLSPENMLYRVMGLFGYQDIDFDTHPDFSKRYLLRGDDEALIRPLFSPEKLSFFEQHPSLCVEAKDDTILFYRQSKRVKPEDIKQFIEETQEILQLFYPDSKSTLAGSAKNE